MIIIGIDCATQESKTGLALGRVGGDKVVIDEALVASNQCPAVETVSKWIGTKKQVLLAIDAPLGWPRSLGDELSNHTAGEALSACPNAMFSRCTDRDLRRRPRGIKPLEVGADRIARTAHRALGLLDELRRETGLTIPLTWQMDPVSEPSAIEVYPAATLAAMGMRHTGYKGKDGKDERPALTRCLGQHLTISDGNREKMRDNDDILDAVVCVLAGHHFIKKCCVAPGDAETADAEREGWIWVQATS